MPADIQLSEPTDAISAPTNGSTPAERQQAISGLLDADLLPWTTQMIIPAIARLLAQRTTRAVEQAERPLRARIRELEAELARVKEAVAKAVADETK